jgi:hypothetical protein
MVVLVGRRVVAWVVAAVVTVTLVAGAVLVAGGGRDRSPAVLPPLDLGGTVAAGADAAREPAPARAVPADVPQLWPPVTYELDGPLPTLPDRARAWKVEDDTDTGRVAALAAALGLRTRPTEGPSGWTVGDGPRTLTVQRLAGLPWTYGPGVMGGCLRLEGDGPDRAAIGLQCLDPDTPVSDRPPAEARPAEAEATLAPSIPPKRPLAPAGGSAGSGAASSPGSQGTGRQAPPVTVKPVAPVRPWRPVDLPTREQAERVARDLATRAGLELGGAEVRVTDAFAARLVTIAPAVGGLPTSGFDWTVGVGSKGRIQYAAGYLGTPEPADTYPLIGVEEGFERLARTPAIRPLLPAEAPAVERDPCPTASTAPCAARPRPARVATVTGVRLGLRLAPAVAMGTRPAHGGYLLPAYLFDLEGGWTGVRAIIAVQDRYLTR